jgi:hypothetical protein
LRRSWAIRESARHAAAFALQSEHIKQIHNTVETGNAVLLGHLTNSTLLEPPTATRTQQTSVITTGASNTKRQKRNKSYRLRVNLPRWFVTCVWELGVHEADGVWTTQIWTVNVRPRHAVVFEYVRSGDVEAVRELRQSGKLSMRDYRDGQYKDESLFEVSITYTTTQKANQAYSKFCRLQPRADISRFAGSCYNRARSSTAMR